MNNLGSQDALLAALQQQNGLGNQSQVYNQLQGVANGTGPNPAQAMLNQSTGQNVAQQAALMGSQRGVGANAGLLARQAGMQGANIQQQAAGQAATMQANQSLGALGQLGGMANQQASNQIGQTNANTQANQQEQSQLLGAQQAYNQAQTSSQASVNAGNAALAQTTMQGQQGMIGGVLNGAAAGVKVLLADGGAVHQMAEGGPAVADASAYQGQSKFGKFLAGAAASQQKSLDAAPAANQTGTQALQSGMGNFTSNLIQALASKPQEATPTPGTARYGQVAEPGLAKGGAVPAKVSPGEKYLNPKAVEQVKAGASPMQVGETIPGKPAVGGAKNSYANDTVDKTLEDGGIVVPRSETQSKNPDRASADFVHKVLAKRKVGC